jgi:hypothetical protein
MRYTRQTGLGYGTSNFNSSQIPSEADKGEMDKIIAKISVAKLIA